MTSPSLATIALRAHRHALIHDEKSILALFQRGEMNRWRDAPLTAEEELGEFRQVVDGRRQAILDFMGKLAHEYPNPRFARLGFDWVATRIPNAFAVHASEDDSYAIGLDPTIHEMLTWLVIAAHWGWLNNETDLFMQLVVDFVRLGFFNMPVAAEKTDYLTRFALAMVRDYELLGAWALATIARFLIAHEMGHIYLGHFDAGRAAKVQLVPDGAENEISGFAFEHEYQADEWAAKGLLQVSTSGLLENVLARTAPAILFGILALIDDLYWPATPLGEHMRRSHPPAADRAVALARLGGPELDVPMPEYLGILFDLPTLISSVRESTKFQEFARRHRDHYTRPTTDNSATER